MTTRRQLLLTAAAGLGTLVLPHARASAAAKTTLRVTYAPANLSPMYEAVFKAFMDENPDIAVTGRGFANYGDLMQDNLRAQITGGLPDVSHEGLNLIRIYADKALAVPLDGYLAHDGGWSAAGYPAAVQRIGQFNGKVHAIPFAVSTPTLFYNLDLVRRAGGDPAKLPADWPEVLALAKSIGGLGSGISGIYYDYASSSAFAFETLLFSRGGSMMSPDEKTLLFNGPEGQWSMDMFRRFGEAGQVDMSRTAALQSFVAGTLGIYSNTSSQLGTLDRNIGDRFGYAMTAVPLYQNGLVPAAGNGMVMFSADDQRREAAWAYIKFASSPKGQAIMAKSSGYVPVNSRTLDDGTMRAFYDAHPNYAVALGQIKDLTAWYLFPGANGVKANDALTLAMGEVATLRKPPDQALADVTSEISKLIGLS